MDDEHRQLDYAGPKAQSPPVKQKSFAMDMNAGRNVRSLVILLLILMIAFAALILFVTSR